MKYLIGKRAYESGKKAAEQLKGECVKIVRRPGAIDAWTLPKLWKNVSPVFS
jgi:hypothetical protein